MKPTLPKAPAKQKRKAGFEEMPGLQPKVGGKSCTKKLALKDPAFEAGDETPMLKWSGMRARVLAREDYSLHADIVIVT